MDKNALFALLRLCLWNQGSAKADEEIYDEMSAHAITALATPVLTSLSLPAELLKQWKTEILQQVMYYEAYLHAQNSLPITKPYVILKGSAAAQYYPCPELRTMGDIDIMPRQEDYEAVCQELLDNGYTEETSKGDKERARHREFVRDGFSVEVHILFASMNSAERVEKFDNLIVSHITESHFLPDLVNGMVLVEHINQHLETGLGLRQILDFMMFVDRCLTDENWPEFEAMLKETELWNLGVTVIRMCEIYLGLKEHAWCRIVDRQLCADLMDYVLYCGNFGYYRDKQKKTSMGRAEKLRHPVRALKELQRRGEENWDGAKKPYLKPFAWLWQGCRIFRETDDLAAGYTQALHHNRLFDTLGVKREARGLVFYENGAYVKKTVKF